MSNFTFIREDRDPRLTYLFSAYEQTAHTQPIEYNGKTYCGLVLTFESARRVALMQGWLEITDELTREENEDTKEDIVEENTKEESAEIVEKTVKPKAKAKRKRSTKPKAKK